MIAELLEQEKTNVAMWIRARVEENSLNGVVLGLSGGIDSSVVAALAVNALGVERVCGVIMPCNSDPQDEKDAMDVAAWLDIQVFFIDIEKEFEALRGNINRNPIGRGHFEVSKLAGANLKARLRMSTLYTIANSMNLMVIGTGNRSELMTGYLTKYGDGGVDIEPLGNFYKSEVFELAKSMDGFPQAIIDKKPSAGLWEGQTDEDELGMSYCRLDTILMAYRIRQSDGHGWDEMLFSAGCPDMAADIVKVRDLVMRSAHKRIMPPSCPRDNEW